MNIDVKWLFPAVAPLATSVILRIAGWIAGAEITQQTSGDIMIAAWLSMMWASLFVAYLFSEGKCFFFRIPFTKGHKDD